MCRPYGRRSPPETIAGFAGKPFADVATEVILPFAQGFIDRDTLHAMAVDAYSRFDHPAVTPLVQIDRNRWVLELFHGPTLAFKDVAMQLLARLMDHALAKRGQRATIVGATSGDTGGAAVEAFRGSKRVDVIVLFPDGRVSDVQRRMMTTPTDANVHAVAIKGTFDDCQALVKAMFNDHAFRDRMSLSGVNSINWARIVAQVTYYFVAAAALGAPHRADALRGADRQFRRHPRRLGRQANGAADRSARDRVELKRHPAARTRPASTRCARSSRRRRRRWTSRSRRTSSGFCSKHPGRDAGFIRGIMGSLAQGGRFELGARCRSRSRRSSARWRRTRALVAETIRRTKAATGYVLDPHTACGVAALEAAAPQSAVPGIVLSTAHPAKFPDAMEKITGVRPGLPPRLSTLLSDPERYEVLDKRCERGESICRTGCQPGIGWCAMTTQISRLSNGLTVVTDAMTHVETTSLGIWVGVGARDEAPAENGISHFLEHMSFKGTATRSAQAIAEEIEAVGGELNAATGLETTAYFARVLKGDEGVAMELIADILLNSSFSSDELEREREVILQEIASTRDMPDDIAFELVNEAAYPDQAVGPPDPRAGRQRQTVSRRPTCRPSWPPTICLARWCFRSLGTCSMKALVRHAEALFGGLSSKLVKAQEAAHYQGGVRWHPKRFEQSHLVLGFEAPSYRDQAYFTAQVFSGLLGGGMSSRLFQEAREKRGLCYSIYSSAWSLNDTGVLAVHAATGPEMMASLIDITCGEFEDVARKGPSAAELNRAKAQLKAGLLMSLESSSARAEQMARHLLAHGRIIGRDELIQNVDAVERRGRRPICAGLCLRGRLLLPSSAPARRHNGSRCKPPTASLRGSASSEAKTA